MANRAVVVDLLVRTGQFTAGMRRASHDMASATTNMETKTKALQMQIGLLGVGMVSFAAVAVSKWAQFDKAMARVEATGGEAAKRIGELNEVAKSDEVISLGYNAVEASDSIYELVKAGVSAADIIGGGMAGAMSLAAAETMDASDAAAIMASALTQFNLSGDQSAHVADLITAAAGKAQGSAHDLGFALKQSGLVANQFGLSIEETTGTLALFASAGLIGSDAGTSLRTMLLHLAGPSTKAARLMKEIGLEVYGANGQMVSMEELANNLRSSMGKLTEEQRNQALATIFGADATRAASLLYREGGDAVVEWTQKVNDAGYAQEVARERMDNLSGDIKKLSATWDRSMIEMGQSGDAPLRKVVQGVTGVVDSFGRLSPVIQGVIMALAGGGGLAVLGVLGISQVVGALSTLQTGLVATGITSQATARKITVAFGAAGKALAAVGLVIALAQLADTLQTVQVSADELENRLLAIENKSADVQTAFSDIGQGWADDVVGKIGQAGGRIDTKNVDDFHKALENLNTDVFGDDVVRFFDDLTGRDGGLRQLGMRLNDVGKELGSMAQTDLPRATDLFNQFVEAAGGGEENVKLLLKQMPAYEDAIYAVANAQGVTLDDTTLLTAATGELAIGQGTVATTADGAAAALDGMSESTATVTAAEVEAQRAHEEYIQSIVDSFTSFSDLGGVYQGVIDGQKAIAQAAAESSEDTKDSWEDFYDGASVSADQYIAELQKQVEAQETWAANLISLTDRAKTELPANMQAAAQEMINELRDLGPEGAAQVALLESMTAPQLQAVVELYDRQGAAAGEAWATSVDSAETPEVDVDTDAANRELFDLKTRVDGLAGSYSIYVNVDPTNAFVKLDALQTRLNNIMAGRTGSIPTPHATGGAVAGPGTATSDSIPAMLSNGEHVLTASDVAKAGGQDAIYRMRSAIQSGMLKFATGGAVGTMKNGRSIQYWRDAYMDYPERLRLLSEIQKQQADLAKTGEDAVTGIDRELLTLDIAKNRQKLADAEYAASIGDQAFWDSRVDYHNKVQKDAEELASQKADYAKDIRRGDLAKGLSGSQSGAYSEIDRVRSSVLPLLSGSAATSLAAALDKAEQAAGGLYDQMDAIDQSLAATTDKAKELQGISDEVKNGLVGGFRLDQVSQTATVNPFTGQVSGGGVTGAGQGMLRSAQAYASKVKAFSQKLKALADKGFAGAILQEVAGMGVDAGIPAADALLALNLADTSALNQAYKDIATFGGEAGQAVTEGFYQGGVAAAQGVVDGLESQKEDIQKAIMDMALAMEDALKKALGIASPSRKFRALMNFVGQGTVLGLNDQQGIVADASARLFDRVTVPGVGGSYGFSGSGYGGLGDVTAALSDKQVERLAVAFETGNVRNINAATAQRNRQMQLTYGARGR